VENVPDQAALDHLQRGVMVQGKKTLPAIARLLSPHLAIAPRNPPIRERQNIPTAWLELTLTEGRNRQVRRMTAAVGYPTLRLIRVAMGKHPQQLTLAGLEPGAWRHLTPSEVSELRSPLSSRLDNSHGTPSPKQGKHRSPANKNAQKKSVKRQKKR
jgi:23S rRNA pseudouridine2457 synthase